MTSARADEWRSRGTLFSWKPAGGSATAVDVFHVELGDPGTPVLLLVHGWPTSSIDWLDVASQLSTRFRVCALDFPGYGFSDKPRGWGYSLERDAELLEHYLSEVVGAGVVAVVAHDRGGSVALLYAGRCARGGSSAHLEHLVLSNGNIFLPLSNLTEAQRRILDKESGPRIVAALTPAQLAQAMGASTFFPPRGPGDPDVEALTATFAHDDGVGVLHETIQYLVERSKDEENWLARLASSPFPVTLVWGLYDTVSPPRVASYVWNEHLMLRPAGGRLYLVPDAHHYLQVDRPDAFVKVLLHALNPASGTAPGPLAPEPASPLLVDAARQRLPSSADLLRVEAPPV